LPTFKDALRKRIAAEKHLDNREFADAILQAQGCAEFSVKDFFRVLGVAYAPKHELKEECFRQALEKLKPKLGDKHEVKAARDLLGKAKLATDLLAKMRNYAYGYTPLNIPTEDLFDNWFEEFAVSAVGLAKSVNINTITLLRKVGLLRIVKVKKGKIDSTVVKS